MRTLGFERRAEALVVRRTAPQGVKAAGRNQSLPHRHLRASPTRGSGRARRNQCGRDGVFFAMRTRSSSCAQRDRAT